MKNIRKSVGNFAENEHDDVRVVQELLNNHIIKTEAKLLPVNGWCDQNTIDTIVLFQEKVMELMYPDGRVDPNGKTIKALNGLSATHGQTSFDSPSSRNFQQRQSTIEPMALMANAIKKKKSAPLGKWSFSLLTKPNYQSKEKMMPELTLEQWVVDQINADSGGSCATRLSNAFNRAGYDTLANAPLLTKHGGIAVSDTKTKKRYVLGAANLAKYLGIGTPHLVSNMEEISGKGIIYFENKHIDLYDASIGEMIGNGALSPNSDLKLVKIFFMPLKD